MCGSVHAPQAPCFFIRVPRLRSLAEIQSVSQVLVCDGRWSVGGAGGAGIRELDLLVTITIELLYKAPVDNIGGITEQERQSSFIKKKKNKKKWPGWCWRQTKATSVQGGWPLWALSVGFGGGCRVWALQPLWVSLIYGFILFMCTVQTRATHPLMRALWICMHANWCVWGSNCDGGGELNAPSRTSWHVLCYIMVRHLTCSFPPILLLYSPCFLAFLSALFCLKAGANFASIDLIIFIVVFVAPQFMAPCFCQLSSKQMWLWRINANVQLH